MEIKNAAVLRYCRLRDPLIITIKRHSADMSPESYEKIWKENLLLSGIHSLV